jgi:hypothetical protein
MDHMKFKDRFNQAKNTKIGRLTILDEPYVIKNKAYFVQCLCECGIKKEINFYCIMQGNTSSCGCFQKERSLDRLKSWMGKNGPPAKKPEGVASFNDLFNNYKHSAKARKIAFLLTKEEFRSITQQNCHYCGELPAQIRESSVRKFNGHYIHNGIDRKNNEIGYILDNCLPCCSSCNYLKRHHNYQKFVDLIIKIGDHLKYEKAKL